MEKVETSVNNEQYEKLKQYCEKNDITKYALIKKLLLKEINGKTLDDFN